MTQLDLLARAALHREAVLPAVVAMLYLGDPFLEPQTERSWPDHDGLRSVRLRRLPTDELRDDRLT